MTDEREIERMIDETNPRGPRLRMEQIDAQIVSEAYHLFPGTTLIVCCLTLRNGYNVVGHSACIAPENFHAEVGRRVARNNARQQIWSLEGYVLMERLAMMREKPRLRDQEG